MLIYFAITTISDYNNIYKIRWPFCSRLIEFFITALSSSNRRQLQGSPCSPFGPFGPVGPGKPVLPVAPVFPGGPLSMFTARSPGQDIEHDCSCSRASILWNRRKQSRLRVSIDDACDIRVDYTFISAINHKLKYQAVAHRRVAAHGKVENYIEMIDIIFDIVDMWYRIQLDESWALSLDMLSRWFIQKPLRFT